MRLAASLAILLLTATTSLAAGDCALKAVSNCATMNDLVWAKDFKPAVQRFAGKRKVAWLGEKDSVSSVLLEVLGGAPDDSVVLKNGLHRLSASRSQSAMERGAVFVTADGRIKAAGVLHFNCGRECEKTYSLAILLEKPDPELAALVRGWGEEQMKANRDNGMDADSTTIAHEQVLTRAK